MKLSYEFLIDDGYRSIGGASFVKFFVNSRCQEISIIINIVDHTISIYNAITTEIIDRKHYSSKLEELGEASFIGVINAKIKFYIE